MIKGKHYKLLPLFAIKPRFASWGSWASLGALEYMDSLGIIEQFAKRCNEVTKQAIVGSFSLYQKKAARTLLLELRLLA